MIFLLVLVNIFIENDTLKKIFIFKNSLLRYIVIKCRNIQLRRWRVKLLAVTLFQFAYHKSEVVITLLPLTPRIFIELKLKRKIRRRGSGPNNKIFNFERTVDKVPKLNRKIQMFPNVKKSLKSWMESCMESKEEKVNRIFSFE